MLQDRKVEKDPDANTTPTKHVDELDASAAIKSVKEELAGCGAASQLDVTVTRKNIKDAVASLDQVFHPTAAFSPEACGQI